ncbi:hypothetical protein PR048_024550 [Dryococelus australis]|uniref:C2 domain-containing protein n=1 Tax=Dryococelus australis TaxID=614101 RepID=A0ABQ9GNW0_9NEOP|nr:hypothetical protein PR048_024550 [Dryococelus australis]
MVRKSCSQKGLLGEKYILMVVHGTGVAKMWTATASRVFTCGRGYMQCLVLLLTSKYVLPPGRECVTITGSEVVRDADVRGGVAEGAGSKSGADLASLAEKGKVGGSSVSSSSSTTSGGEDDFQQRDRSLRHRDAKGATSRKTPLHCSVHAMDEEAVSAEPPPPLPPASSPLQHHEPGTTTANQDCIVTLPQEQLFDVTDLQSEFGDQDGHLVSKCGHLEVAFAYDAPIRKMTVRVLQARDIPAKDRGGASNTQVRLLMLPSKKQKHKTKIRHGDNPQFMESFLLHRVNPEDVNSMGVRFRLYGCERMRRERMIGECVVSFSCINLELETTMWLILEPRANLTVSTTARAATTYSLLVCYSLSHVRVRCYDGFESTSCSRKMRDSAVVATCWFQLNTSASDLLSLARSDSTGSTHSMQHGGVPELLLGLSYNGTTGRLSVEVVKGSHFRNLAMTRPPDTYVKLCLVSSSGQEMARSKTSIRRGQPNPLFKETFMFQVSFSVS